jgi:DNA-binding SARP family transcriptional activator
LPLLVYLAMRPGTAVTRSRLAALLWPDEPEETGRANLRRHLHHLQRALPPSRTPWITTQGASVCWSRDADAWIDVVEFDRLAADESGHESAVALYRGDLAEPLFEEWLIGERERLRAMQLDMLYGLGICARARRDFPAAVGYADQILALDEWREDAVRLSMAARYESGDRSAALSVYDRFAARLQSELHVDPMPETQALRNGIVQNSALEAPQAIVHASLQHAVRHALPLVGRASEMEELRSAWTRAARGNGTVVFIAGEAGIGKSRLVSDLALSAEAEGGRVLWGTTAEPESSPYQPFVEALRAGLPYLRDGDGEMWLAALAQLIPEIAGVYRDLPAPPPLEPENEQKRLLESIAQAFAQLSRVRPVLLVLEDLHWATRGTLAAFETLAHRIARVPVLLLATYRSDEMASKERLREIRRSLQRQRYASQIALARLSAGDIQELAVHADLPHDLAAVSAFVYRISEGNALFAAQLLREIAEAGALPDESHAHRTLRTAIVGRLSRLDPRVCAVAQTASVLGRTFSVDVLAEIGGWNERMVLDVLGDLLDRSLVSEQAGTHFEYAFTHALIESAIYETMDPGFRAAKHRRAAQVLERVHRGDRAFMRVIATHWDRAGERAYARAAYQHAAEAALAIFARDQAVWCAHRALDLSEDDAERYAALSVAANAQAHYGDVGAWHSEVLRLCDAAERLGNKERFAALEMRERLEWQMGDRAAQRETIARMSALAEACDCDGWRVTALYALGNLCGDEGRFRDAEAPLQDALRIAEMLGDGTSRRGIRQRLIQMWVRGNNLERAKDALEIQRRDVAENGSDADRLQLVRAEATFGIMAEDADIAQRTGEEMLALARRLGLVEAEGKALQLLAAAAQIRMDVENAVRYYEGAIEIAERLGQAHALAVSLVNYGGLMAECGHLEEAAKLLKRAVPIAQRANAQTALANAYLVLAEAETDGERFHEALRSAQKAYDIARLTDEQKLLAGTLVYRGRAKAGMGDLEAALADLREGLSLREQTMATRQIVDDRCSLLEALLLFGDSKEARRQTEELMRSYSDDLGNSHPRAISRVCLVLGKAFESFGEPQRAKQWFDIGRAQLKARLAAFARAQDAQAYAALPFNRELAGR